MSDLNMTSVDREPQRLHAALTAAGDVAYDWDLVTDTITWHGSVAVMLGIADASVIASGRALAGRLNPDDLLLRQQRLNAHWTGHAAFDCEYRIRAESGGFAWVPDRGSGLFDTVGGPAKIQGGWRLINSPKPHDLK